MIEAQHIRVYSCPIDSEDESVTNHNKDIMAAMPFAIIGSTQSVKTPDGRTVVGRAYSWGVAEVENEQHCDFKKLRNLLIRSHMLDLISTTEEVHYENYRQQQMANRKFGEPKPQRPLRRRHREKEEALRKAFTEQVKQEEQRFRKWEEQVPSIYIIRSLFGSNKLLTTLCSLLPSAIDSTRIWKTNMQLSRPLKAN